MLTLLRKNNSDDITAFHDAVMNYAMFGDGVIDGVYDSLACAGPLNNVFSIKSGFILFGGRLCVIAKGTMQDINISSFSLNQKIYIYLKLVIASDDEESRCEIVASASKPNTSAIPTHSNTGVFNMLLYTLSANTRTSTANFGILKPGVAKNALNLLAEGKIGEVKVTDIFLGDWSGVQYAKNCDVAAEARGFQGGSINVVSKDLKLSNRGVYLLQSSMIVDINEQIVFAAKAEKTSSFDTKLSGRKLVAVCASTNAQNDLTFQNPTIGLQKSTPSQFGLENNALSVKIDSSSKKVTIRNQTDNQVTINGLHIMILMYGGSN